MDKKWWLDFAEVQDALRVMPKLFLIALLLLYGFLTADVWAWFKAASPIGYTDMQYAAMVGAATGFLTILGGMLTSIFNKYIETGRKWEERESEEPPRCPTCGRVHND